MFCKLICWHRALDADLRSSLTVETDVADGNFFILVVYFIMTPNRQWKWVLCSMKCLFIRWDCALSWAGVIKALPQSLYFPSLPDKIKEVTSVNSASVVLQSFTKTLLTLCWVFSRCLAVVRSGDVRIHYSCQINDLFTVGMYCLMWKWGSIVCGAASHFHTSQV